MWTTIFRIIVVHSNCKEMYYKLICKDSSTFVTFKFYHIPLKFNSGAKWFKIYNSFW